MTQERESRESPAEIVSRAKDLASLPDIYFRVQTVLDDPTSSHDDIAATISIDPAMSARLLRMANSAFYGRPHSVATISRAIALLGTQQVHDLVLAATVIHSFDDFSSDLVNPRDFWMSSLFAGAVAKILAEQSSILDCERLFVAGLLAPVGVLIMYQEMPTQMRQIMRQASGPGDDMAMRQRELFGFDYAQVSTELFSRWQLPSELIDPIRQHTNPSAAGDGMLEAGILNIALRVAMAETDSQGLDQLIPSLNDDAWRVLDLSAERLEQVRDAARGLTDEIVPALLSAAA